MIHRRKWKCILLLTHFCSYLSVCSMYRLDIELCTNAEKKNDETECKSLYCILLVKSLAAASRRYNRTRQRTEDKIIQKLLHFYILNLHEHFSNLSSKWPIKLGLNQINCSQRLFLNKVFKDGDRSFKKKKKGWLITQLPSKFNTEITIFYISQHTGVKKNLYIPLKHITLCACFSHLSLHLALTNCSESPFRWNVHLSLHKPDKGLNELDKRLLTFMDCLRAWCGGLGLGRGKEAASWWQGWTPAEVARQAGQKGALGTEDNTNVRFICSVKLNLAQTSV